MSDFDACVTMDRDPEVTKYIPGPWTEPERHERFLRDRIQASFGAGFGYWSIFSKIQPDNFLGWIMLIPYDGIGPEIEIGWRLDRLSWGNGYATEAALPIVGHAFETVDVNRIVADIAPENAGSLRVAEKIGMRFVGDGEYKGHKCKSYVMTRDDYRTDAMPSHSVA